MTKRMGLVVAALAFGLVISAVGGGKAQAANMICDGGIENIDFRPFPLASSNSELLIGCRSAQGNVTPMYSYTALGSCTNYNQSIDMLKFWFSMTSAWALSSKKVQIYFDVCGSQNRITAISLRR